jgi:thioredoxin
VTRTRPSRHPIGSGKENKTFIIREEYMEHLTKAAFLEKVFDFEKNQEWNFAGELPVVIDFYADWCAPCRMVAPVLEELSREYAGKVNIYKIDTEQEQELASVFGIRSIPSILFVPKEGKPQMAMGALPKEGFVEAFESVLKVPKPLITV